MWGFLPARTARSYAEFWLQQHRKLRAWEEAQLEVYRREDGTPGDGRALTQKIAQQNLVFLAPSSFFVLSHSLWLHFSTFVPYYTTLRSSPIKSNKGNNWRWCHHHLLLDWESRHNTKALVRGLGRMGGFYERGKAHTGVLPAKLNLLPLLVTLCTSPHVLLETQAPLVKKHCAMLNLPSWFSLLAFPKINNLEVLALLSGLLMQAIGNIYTTSSFVMIWGFLPPPPPTGMSSI